MNKNRAQGSCLCGEVTYEISGNLGIFQYCHCSRCRKFTGSVHAANIIIAPEHFTWLQGESLVVCYTPEHTRHFATAFCKNCGSSLPWHSKSGKSVVIPAGTLDGHPNIEPHQNVFYASKASWYKPASELSKHDALPKK